MRQQPYQSLSFFVMSKKDTEYIFYFSEEDQNLEKLVLNCFEASKYSYYWDRVGLISTASNEQMITTKKGKLIFLNDFMIEKYPYLHTAIKIAMEKTENAYY